MVERKSLYDISWQVTESEYREDPALSYSVLAKFERGGFNELDHLFDRIDTPSLTFGSAVDSIITGGQEEFDERFIVADYPSTPDSIIKIVKDLFNSYHESHESIITIPDADIITFTELNDYQRNWKPETRAKVIKEKGSDYYNLLHIADNKTIINNELYAEITDTVYSLKNSNSTRFYFQNDSPFEPDIQRHYQLKFKATFEGIDYRCMADEIIVDHKTKEIFLIDLKTSSHTEWDFPVSFKDWFYWCQARLYYRIIKSNLEKDEYFKDFTIHDYRFIVVNKRTLTPLVWEYEDTKKYGTLYYGVNSQYVVRDPFEIGEELTFYLKDKPKVPKGISETSPNSLLEFLNKL